MHHLFLAITNTPYHTSSKGKFIYKKQEIGIHPEMKKKKGNGKKLHYIMRVLTPQPKPLHKSVMHQRP